MRIVNNKKLVLVLLVMAFDAKNKREVIIEARQPIYSLHNIIHWPMLT